MIGERIQALLALGDEAWPDYVIVTDGGAYLIGASTIERIKLGRHSENRLKPEYRARRIEESRTDGASGVVVLLDDRSVIVIDAVYDAGSDAVYRTVDYQDAQEFSEWHDEYAALKLIPDV